jgi:hypothetical protein
MKAPLTLSILVACLVSPVLVPAFTLTQWEYNGLAVCTAYSGQWGQECISDGAGGVFITWVDVRSQTAYEVYVQHVTKYGMTMWATDGIPVCTDPGSRMGGRLAPDGAGGVIVTWGDSNTGAGYAQRINAAGALQWGSCGVTVHAAPGAAPHIVSDGAGGAVLAWKRADGSGDIYAQRINASGALLWNPAGVPVSTAPGNQDLFQLVSDGNGGAIAVWRDDRSGNPEAYAQQIDGSGTPMWTTDGVLISSGPVTILRASADGYGGVLVAYWIWDAQTLRSTTFVQRVGPTGTLQWTPGGVVPSFIQSNQYSAVVAPDGSGGAIVVWEDDRNGVDNDLYAQRINASGNLQWAGSGVPVCTAYGTQQTVQAVPDGSGGVIAAWEDFRLDSNSPDVFAQRISAAGIARWATDGEAVCTAAYGQYGPILAPDGAGAAIVVWGDARTLGNGDIFAQRIEGRFGYWGRPEPVAVSATDVPADQGGKVRVNWGPSDRDVLNEQIISHYSVWRAASAAAAQAAIAAGVPSVELADVGEAFAGPAIREETTASGASAFWELVGAQDAVYLEGYSLTVPTGYDSSAAGPATHDFQVLAHAWGSPQWNWPSNVVSGYSVDNLAPPPPLYLTAQRMGNDVRLKWNRVRVPDLKNYAVYRATSSGVSPVPVNFLSNSTDSLVLDTGAPLTTLYYIVTAKDVHENQSAASNEAFVSGATNVGNTPAVTQFTVLQNYPNPFTTGTEFQVGLPAPSDVTVEIYDVAGRRVGSLSVRDAAAGWQRIPFAGRDDRGGALASGVYFYRITANGSTVTRKMVIAR